MADEGEVLNPFADGVWLAREPVSIVGMTLSATMAVLRLADGGLLLHSPISLTHELRRSVEALGPVAHLYAPNTFHHLHVGGWAGAFPEATVHAPVGLTGKRRDLRIDRTHPSMPEPAFADCVDEIPIRGFRLEETALFYRPARLLVLADLVHNIGRPQQRWARVYTRAMGFYDRVALSRMIRWTAFRDRRGARDSVDQLLALPFDRIVVGHGAPIVQDAKLILADSLSWLAPGSN